MGLERTDERRLIDLQRRSLRLIQAVASGAYAEVSSLPVIHTDEGEVREVDGMYSKVPGHATVFERKIPEESALERNGFQVIALATERYQPSRRFSRGVDLVGVGLQTPTDEVCLWVSGYGTAELSDGSQALIERATRPTANNKKNIAVGRSVRSGVSRLIVAEGVDHIVGDVFGAELGYTERLRALQEQYRIFFGEVTGREKLMLPSMVNTIVTFNNLPRQRGGNRLSVA